MYITLTLCFPKIMTDSQYIAQGSLIKINEIIHKIISAVWKAKSEIKQ